MTAHGNRRGFTLVELLVVASIMAIFFAMVVTGTRPNPGAEIRQAAQLLASSLTSTQSRALGSSAGAAVIFESGTSSSLPATMSTTVFHADVPPFILGLAQAITPIGSGSATVSVLPQTADPEDLPDGYKIRFGGIASGTIPYQPPSPWFAFAFGSANPATVGFRSILGQTPATTIWPEPTRSGTSPNPFVVQIARYPVTGDVAVEFPKSVAIDLRYSGIGEDLTTIWNQTTWVQSGTAVGGWGNLGGKGSIALSFNAIGGLDSLMQQVQQGTVAALRQAQPPIDPTEPVYLLINSRDAIESATQMPLASEQAIWVVIHPQNGRVSIANNVPQQGTDDVALRAARAKARAGVIGGK